jgi:hypothetical protein
MLPVVKPPDHIANRAGLAYAPLGDGRFLATRATSESRPATIHLTTNWKHLVR